MSLEFLLIVIDCNGQRCAVVTIANPGESAAELAERHAEDVAQAEADCAAGGDCSRNSTSTFEFPDGRTAVAYGPRHAELLDALRALGG